MNMSLMFEFVYLISFNLLFIHCIYQLYEPYNTKHVIKYI